MAELTFDIVELVLKQVSKACAENKDCKGCQFEEITKNEFGGIAWHSCRISCEPHTWKFADKEGADE